MVSEEQMKYLATLFRENLTELSDIQVRQFIRYYELLVEKNEVMNLTSITEFNEVIIKHFLDSCMLWKYVKDEKISSVIDVGTGAGFPGVPLKIIRPEIELLLMDALQKRIGFLCELGAALHFSGVTCEHSRAEDGVKAHREVFDLAVSRAVSGLSVLSEYCLPFVNVGGLFTAYKSGEIDAELFDAQNAISVLGGKTERVERFTLPDGSERSIIFIRKVKETPAKYPRKAGKPQKAPL